MSDDDPIYDDDEPSGIDRKLLLVVLAGMTGLAITLALLQTRMKRSPMGIDDVITPAGYEAWEASLQHLAETWDMRFAAIDNRLNALAGDRVAAQAAVSSPPVALSQENGSVERIPPQVAVGPVADVPGPAATSM
jgi:hypothetical protein